MSSFKKILFFLSPSERKNFYFIIFMITAMAMLETVGVASIVPFLAVVGNPDAIESNRWLFKIFHGIGFERERSFLMFLGVSAFIFILFSNAFKTFTLWLKIKFVHNANYNLSRKLMKMYLFRPYAFFLARNSNDLSKNIIAEAEHISVQVLGTGLQFIAYLLVAVFLVSLLVIINPGLALLATLSLGGAYVLIYMIVRAKLTSRGKLRIQANQGRFFAVGEAFGGIKDVKFMNLENEFARRFEHPAGEYARHKAFSELVAQVPQFTLQLIAFGGIILVTLFLLGREDNLGQILPVLGLYAFAALKLLPALQHVFAALSKLRFGIPALDNFYREMAGKNLDRLEMDASNSYRTEPIRFKKSLKLSNVYFSYPGSEVDVLQDLSIVIPARASVGLVGSTGSGKTTLVDVILGLFHPSRGSLLADDIPITPENVQAWQQGLGYVPQHIFLSDATVIRNIAFGVPEKEIDMERVVQAAQMASLHSFIQDELPGGYISVVGERGVRLSGGQRQRIGIARALYRNPEVLILDEATSALDNTTEKQVMHSIRKLCGTKTVIIIAHRLTTVEHCDIIYMLDRGRVAAVGNYRELLSRNRSFQKMASARTGS